MMGKPQYYAIYLRKNDTLLASGSADECRKALGCATLRAFYALTYRARSGKSAKYDVYAEDLEEDENE